MQRRAVFPLISFGLLWPNLSHTTPTPAPPLWLANTYRSGVVLQDYWVSEKYDGIRGYWNGHQLLTRKGKILNPPDWFVKNWPSTPIEGELWAGRGQFQLATATAQRTQASDEAWRTLRFMVFDAPAHEGTFTERIAAYQSMAKTVALPWVHAVEQWAVYDPNALEQLLTERVKAGAEGLMLHRAQARYKAGRSNDQLKLKPQDDAEAKVIGHVPGHGKYAQSIGALWVETPQGQRFKLGTGFSDDERQTPPAIGQWVTYTYRGHTDQGIPRFASYVRTQPAIER
jgi:DNA ligase-1